MSNMDATTYRRRSAMKARLLATTLALFTVVVFTAPAPAQLVTHYQEDFEAPDWSVGNSVPGNNGWDNSGNWYAVADTDTDFSGQYATQGSTGTSGANANHDAGIAAGLDTGRIYTLSWTEKPRANPHNNLFGFRSSAGSAVGINHNSGNVQLYVSAGGPATHSPLVSLADNGINADTLVTATITVDGDGPANELSATYGGISLGPIAFTDAEMASLNALRVFVDTSGGRSPPARDDILLTSVVPVAFDEVTVGDVIGLRFLSESNGTYKLESTTDLVTSNDWSGTGAFLLGNGTNQLFFDPAGFSTNKAYRIVSVP